MTRIKEEPEDSGAAGERLERTVVHLDLVGYSDKARALEEQLGSDAVMQLNRQIQGFVDCGLKAIGQDRAGVVHGTAGDSALLLLPSPTLAHHFAETVHQSTTEHNRGRTRESAMRRFRIGIATGEISKQGKEIAGITIANAVRLEAAAAPDGILIDDATYNSLPPTLQALYRGPEQVKGKRQEVIPAWRAGDATAKAESVPTHETPQPDVFALFERISDQEMVLALHAAGAGNEIPRNATRNVLIDAARRWAVADRRKAALLQAIGKYLDKE